ncbi:MAG: sigma 54-interacting transcriptional regulator [Desulfotomaculales bacterium]
MQKEILLLSPGQDFSKLVGQTCREIGETGVEIVDVGCRRSVLEQVLNDPAAKNFKVVIMKRYWRTWLPADFTIPVVFMYNNSFDLLYVLAKIKRHVDYRNVAYFGYEEEVKPCNFAAFSEILGEFNLIPFIFDSSEQIEPQMHKAIAARPEIIITTAASLAKKIEKAGIPTRVLYPSKESIVESLRRAREIILARRKESERVHQLSAILDQLNDGVMVVDSGSEKILAANKKAQVMLGLLTFHVPGLRIEKTPAPLPEILGSIEENKHFTAKIGEQKVIISCLPIWLNSCQSAKMITLRKVEDVELIEQCIRKEALEKRLVARATFQDIRGGKNRRMREVIEQAKKFARTDSTILITGESGTGKEIFAQSIHNESRRKSGPFVAINCASLPESILDSELFGYERGTFTGADKNGKMGLFELAHQGTIFLDEITEIPLSLQSKLLRVLQEREIRRLGGRSLIPVDVRVIAATGADIEELVREKKFRADLYFRLNVLRLDLPPLRERKEDLVELIIWFYHQKREELQRCGVEVSAGADISEELISRLTAYSWPGNIRELLNVIERFLLTGSVENLGAGWPEAGPRETFLLRPGEKAEVLSIPLNEEVNLQEQVILELLKKYGSNKEKVARMLGISRTTLWRKMRSLKLSV